MVSLALGRILGAGCGLWADAQGVAYVARWVSGAGHVGGTLQRSWS